MEHNCGMCIYLDICDGNIGICDWKNQCEYFCSAMSGEDTYLEMMPEIYQEYYEDYLNYLEVFNR